MVLGILDISIHTTAKVVTRRELYPLHRFDNFNPHHREGGDPMGNGIADHTTDFNPHHREGGDSVVVSSNIFCAISIHTTAKVVTYPLCARCLPASISIHTTAKVVTDGTFNGFFVEEISIHTTAKVVTLQR